MSPKPSEPQSRSKGLGTLLALVVVGGILAAILAPEAVQALLPGAGSLVALAWSAASPNAAGQQAAAGRLSSAEAQALADRAEEAWQSGPLGRGGGEPDGPGRRRPTRSPAGRPPLRGPHQPWVGGAGQGQARGGSVAPRPCPGGQARRPGGAGGPTPGPAAGRRSVIGCVGLGTPLFAVAGCSQQREHLPHRPARRHPLCAGPALWDDRRGHQSGERPALQQDRGRPEAPHPRLCAAQAAGLRARLPDACPAGRLRARLPDAGAQGRLRARLPDAGAQGRLCAGPPPVVCAPVCPPVVCAPVCPPVVCAPVCPTPVCVPLCDP
jgi:hypothetical protein